jgi:hypothetical protein
MQQLGYGLEYDRLAIKLDIASEEILRISLKNQLKDSTAQKIEDILNINKEWLKYGTGKIYKESEQNQKNISQKSHTDIEYKNSNSTNITYIDNISNAIINIGHK